LYEYLEKSLDFLENIESDRKTITIIENRVKNFIIVCKTIFKERIDKASFMLRLTTKKKKKVFLGVRYRRCDITILMKKIVAAF
jgi:hypothetical protein